MTINQRSDGNETCYELFSDRIRRVFPEYALDEGLRFIPKAGTPTINFNSFKELMCSKDLSRLAELTWIDKKLESGSRIFKQRFLDGMVDMTGNRVSLSSFPRAGNSLTRSYLEKITGITTGSEAYSDITLQLIGLIGDGHNADDNVWITKSHFPIAAPFMVATFNINKQIYLMRNPLDVIVSVAHMCMTISHELVPREQYHIDFPEFWNDWINQMTANLASYHGYVLQTIGAAIPTYILRYEDLCNNPVASLTELMEFLMEVPSLKGSVCEARIKEVTAKGAHSQAIYKLKNSTSKYNKHAHMYNEE